MVKLARRTLLRRTVQGRRRVWIAGPARWPVGALLPVAPAAIVASAPTGAEFIPGFLFLVAVIGATVVAGRGPGLLAAGVSAMVLALVAVDQSNDSAGGWLWAAVFFGLNALAVNWVDNLLSDAARRATAVLDPLVEAAPVGIALFDQELRFVRANAALAELSQRSPGAHLGRPLTEVLPNVPADLVTALQMVLTNGSVLRHHLISIDVPGRPVCQLMVDAFPVRLTGGPITGVGAVVADVTERYRLEQFEREAEQLQATARLGHRLLESQRIAQMAGFEVDVVAKRSIWSDELCQLMGRTAHPADEDEARAHVHPDELPRLFQFAKSLRASGAPFRIETRMIHTDGRIREVVVHGEAVRTGDNPDADVVGFWGVLQDITDARAAEREMAAAQREAEEARELARSERRLLELFQRAMLPADLPVVPGASLAADYIAVADQIDVGGDWYDAFGLPDGRIALSIGDVIGHDQQAAAIMGQLRTTSRGYALEEPEPGTVLARLNRLLALTYPTGTLVSAVVGLYDPGIGTLAWANAGHPHPLLAVPGAEVQVLETADPILGATTGRGYRTHQLVLPPGSTLLCYTDGLIERRAGDLLAGQDALIELLHEAVAATATATAVVEHVTRGMSAAAQPEDDVCVLVLQRYPDICEDLSRL